MKEAILDERVLSLLAVNFVAGTSYMTSRADKGWAWVKFMQKNYISYEFEKGFDKLQFISNIRF